MRSGPRRVVMPALIGATKIAHMITRPSAEEMLVSLLGKSQLNEELQGNRAGVERDGLGEQLTAGRTEPWPTPKSAAAS